MKELFIRYALLMMNTPYVWGGNSVLTGYDCSGYVLDCLESIGAGPQRDMTSQGLFDWLSMKQRYPFYNTKPGQGDILFFGDDVENVSHVAIAYDSKHMIEAGGGDSSVTNIDEAIEKDARVRIRPISNRKDFLAAIRIF